MSARQSIAGSPVTRHLARGIIGFAALIGSVALIPVLGVVSLTLAPVGLVALRGCPACWVIGLAQAISQGRPERSCVGGRCEPAVVSDTRAPDSVAVGQDAGTTATRDSSSGAGGGLRAALACPRPFIPLGPKG